MFKKLYSLLLCFLIILASSQKLQKENDLYYIFKGEYEKDLCTPTNDTGFATCELYTFIIKKQYNILKIDGQNVEKEIKIFSKKINKKTYQIYDNNSKVIGEIYNLSGNFYLKYNGFLKKAEEKIERNGYKFNKIR
ncbi:hypothetical protein OF897_07020 [Chryseobacterium formosus]|uniref:MORN repeat variant n=1 Tax=Chryseobacterium formosus TaxID=1537363 RepID=A0ABT3XNG6_9FLAO|nr:hypothetical protein [Chryseobacterium formosus]MCX8523672.1 hypothetical protein [Chryseobacterium formosus]